TLLYLKGGNLVDRSTAELNNHPEIRSLFPDAYAEGKRFFEKTGLYPINHGMVIKRELVEKHPWVVLNIFNAFVEANRVVDRQRLAHAAYWLETGMLPKSARETLQRPLADYGVVANRGVLEAISRYSFEQGLTSRRLQLDEVFAANTL